MSSLYDYFFEEKRMTMVKIENFRNEKHAIMACNRLVGVPHVRLGTAVIVDLNRYTTTLVTNVMCDFGAHTSSNITGYDCKAFLQVLS
jgi:hypothetical protein